MGFSRNLGLVTSESLEAAAVAATTVESVDMAAKKFVSTPQLEGEDQGILTSAVAVAKAALVTMGGFGDVHLGGGVTHMSDGRTQRSISVIVTVTSE